MAHSSCEAVRGEAPPPTPDPSAHTIALNAPYDARAGAAWALLIANIGDEEINPTGHDRGWTEFDNRGVGRAFLSSCSGGSEGMT